MFKLFKSNKTETRTTRTIPLVSGMVVRAGEDTYMIKSGKRLYRLFSERVFESWGLPRYDIELSKLAGYKKVGILGFRDGSLIQNVVDGKIYMVSDSKRRLITNPDVLDSLGIDIILVSEAEIRLHDEGENIDGN